MDELADRLPPTTGGPACLDFVNTVDPGMVREADRDHLGGSYPGLVAWAEHAGVLSRERAFALRRLAGRHTTDATRAYAEAVRLREAIYAVFHAVATGREAADRDTGVIRGRYAAAVHAAELAPDSDGWRWEWTTPDDLYLPLHLLAASAVDLLTAGRPDRVRLCAGGGCGWLFLDRSRNGSRRWCLMRYCGNALKSSRQAATRRAARRARR